MTSCVRIILLVWLVFVELRVMVLQFPRELDFVVEKKFEGLDEGLIYSIT